jgi:hypothetical protein
MSMAFGNRDLGQFVRMAHTSSSTKAEAEQALLAHGRDRKCTDAVCRLRVPLRVPKARAYLSRREAFVS